MSMPGGINRFVIAAIFADTHKRCCAAIEPTHLRGLSAHRRYPRQVTSKGSIGVFQVTQMVDSQWHTR